MENKPVALILEPEPMQRDLMALALQNLNSAILWHDLIVANFRRVRF